MDARGRLSRQVQSSKLRALTVSKFEVPLGLLFARLLAYMPCELYADSTFVVDKAVKKAEYEIVSHSYEAFWNLLTSHFAFIRV